MGPDPSAGTPSTRNQPPQHPSILPMIRSNSTNLDLQIWNASNPAYRNRTLLSPNWGTSWFGKPSFKELQKQRERTLSPTALAQCGGQWTSVVQNAMFAPTPVSVTMHQKRVAALSLQSGYGAVHLRTQFIMRKNPNFTAATAIDSMLECIEKTPGIPKVSTWWIIADDEPLARKIAGTKRSDTAKVSFVHAYDADFTNHSKHSNNKEAKALDGHYIMATSAQDWMALYSAEVVLQAGGGAYGQTGARGKGKYNRKGKGGSFRSTNYCGGVFTAWF